MINESALGLLNFSLKARPVDLADTNKAGAWC